MSIVPAAFLDLLERPLYGSLATVNPKNKAQSSVMWYAWDGERLKFTHTAKRQKYRNLLANPSAAFSVYDPENPYRYLEIRGTVDEITPTRRARSSPSCTPGTLRPSPCRSPTSRTGWSCACGRSRSTPRAERRRAGPPRGAGGRPL